MHSGRIVFSQSMDNAVLIRAAASWQNINITSTELLQLLYEERQIAPSAEMVAVA